MITALVQITVPEPLEDDEVRTAFDQGAVNYLSVPGLVRKYYLLSEDRRTLGGVYLWRSKEDALRVFTPQWRRVVMERYRGPEPSVTYFETPVVVESGTQRIDRFWDDAVVGTAADRAAA